MARDDLSKLDLSGLKKLEAQAEDLEGEITKLVKAVGKLREEKGGLEAMIASLDK